MKKVTTMKTREEILAALQENIPQQEIIPVEIEPTPHGPSDAVLIKDSEDDFEFARANVKKLASTSDDAIAVMLSLAQDSEHPRAFEVLANLIKTAADTNKQLIDLAKDRKKLLRGDSSKRVAPLSPQSVTNNAIFVGTTADLQRKLAESKAREEIIDVPNV
jgi:hypothetical protein